MMSRFLTVIKNNPVITVLVAALIAMVVAAQAYKHRAEELAFEADSLGLEILNQEARHDSTVIRIGTAIRVLAQQHAITVDSLQSELGLARVRASGDVQVQVDTQTVVQVIQLDSTFTLDQPPFHLVAQIQSGPPVTIRGTFSLDPIPLSVAVGCSEPTEVRDLRHAMVTVDGPDWASVSLSNVSAEPDVCNPQFGVDRSQKRSWGLMGAFTGGLAGGAAGLVAGDTWKDVAAGSVVGALLGFIIDMLF